MKTFHFNADKMRLSLDGMRLQQKALQDLVRASEYALMRLLAENAGEAELALHSMDQYVYYWRRGMRRYRVAQAWMYPDKISR